MRYDFFVTLGDRLATHLATDPDAGFKRENNSGFITIHFRGDRILSCKFVQLWYSKRARKRIF